MNKNAARRPSRAAVARSLRELEILWRPPDPHNDNAPRQRGAGDTTKHLGSTPGKGVVPPNSTLARAKRKAATA